MAHFRSTITSHCKGAQTQSDGHLGARPAHPKRARPCRPQRNGIIGPRAGVQTGRVRRRKPRRLVPENVGPATRRVFSAPRPRAPIHELNGDQLTGRECGRDGPFDGSRCKLHVDTGGHRTVTRRAVLRPRNGLAQGCPELVAPDTALIVGHQETLFNGWQFCHASATIIHSSLWPRLLQIVARALQARD